MQKKKVIDDRIKTLSEREEKLKLQLCNDSHKIKNKIKNIGKIVLVAGITTLVGYLIFSTPAHHSTKSKKN